MATPDLTTIYGVQAYLLGTPFASDAITPLSGGTANFTYRIRLTTPFEGHSTLILKHAQPYVKNIETVAFGLQRQVFEVTALTRVKAWLPKDSIVTVPKVHRFDQERHVMIIEDCGERTLTLKQFLEEGRSSPRLAENIGTAIGQFLGALHAWGRENHDGILELFKGNKQAKSMSAWVTYGRLVSTLTGQDNLSALSDPPMNVSERDMEVITKLATDTTLAMTSARDFFVMGDFWPGNMMITLDSESQLERIYVIDWELAGPGLPGVEIGQFCADINLLHRFVPYAKESASIILSGFLEAYAHLCNPDIQTCRDALAHWSGHLVVLTPRISWGTKDTTRAVVYEGVESLVKAHTESEEWLKESLIGPLVPRSSISPSVFQGCLLGTRP